MGSFVFRHTRHESELELLSLGRLGSRETAASHGGACGLFFCGPKTIPTNADANDFERQKTVGFCHPQRDSSFKKHLTVKTTD